jgi:hypothetical protein
VPARPTEIPDSLPPEVLHDLDTAARVLAELDERGLEITLALEPAGLCIRARASALDRGRVLPAMVLLDMLISPDRNGRRPSGT